MLVYHSVSMPLCYRSAGFLVDLAFHGATLLETILVHGEHCVQLLLKCWFWQVTDDLS